jgi:dolichol-phosphate mannosyltransferase
MVAMDGILSFSTVPLRLATLLGLAMTCSSLLVAVAYVIWRILDPNLFGVGWPSLFVAILLFGGIQLIVLGILGEYMARIFVEVQNRPIYWVDYELGFDEQAAARYSTRRVPNESGL